MYRNAVVFDRCLWSSIVLMWYELLLSRFSISFIFIFIFVNVVKGMTIQIDAATIVRW